MKIRLLFLLIGALKCSGEDWCAIRVSAQNVRGNPMSVQAKLIDRSGTIVALTGPAEGSITFCDIPFGPHSIRVEADGYFPSSIHDVQIRFGQSQHFVIVVNSSAIGDGTSNGCEVNLRVLDEHGKGLARATLASGSFRTQADAYGRISTGLLTSKKREFTVTAPNYGSKAISLQCKTVERIQQVVALAPVK